MSSLTAPPWSGGESFVLNGSKGHFLPKCPSSKNSPQDCFWNSPLKGLECACGDLWGRCPHTPASLLKKAWPKTYLLVFARSELIISLPASKIVSAFMCTNAILSAATRRQAFWKRLDRKLNCWFLHSLHSKVNVFNMYRKQSLHIDLKFRSRLNIDLIAVHCFEIHITITAHITSVNL